MDDMRKIKKHPVLFLFVFLIFVSISIFASTRIIHLTVAYKTVDFTGKKAQAIAVNNQIPAPTLHFKEGDHVVITVTNHLNEGTIIHWHGILVPWQMDGVEGISQHAIPPGKTFRYHFTMRQSGTYWYHDHAGFQEQQGVYGALIIAPKGSHIYHSTKDYPVVLSDWSNTNPNRIYKNLKMEGDYYSPRFPLQPSLVKFIRDYKKANSMQRTQLWNDYISMQQSRMSIYDLSDVAYDAFLLNGHTNQNPWKKLVKVGDIVRLRFIDAGASTNFNIKIPDHDMTIIGLDGNDVKPEKMKDIFITPGETYDVLVKIKNNYPVLIYAESADTSGHVVGALITQTNQIIPTKSITPFPDPMPVTQEMMNNMMPKMHSMHDMHDMTSNQSTSMPMQTEPSIIGDHLEKPRKALLAIKTTGTKYQHIIAFKKTNNPKKPIYRVIQMQLFGYMDRYIWMINGLPEYKAKPIVLKPGKRYRIIFTNPTMMHHPMHIHGHWFILRNGHGAYDPLLHTIDLAPGATVVADVDTDASGQWFFHCHQLYHMMAGMARVIQYQTIINVVRGKQKPEHIIGSTGYDNRPIVRVDEDTPFIPALINHPMGHPTRFYTANFLDIGEDPWNNAQEFTYKGMFGGDYNKLKLYAEDAEIENGKVTDFNLDIFYWHLISQFWAIEGGANYFNEPAYKPYWQPGVGIVGLMPFFIDTELRMYLYNDSVKFDFELSRDTQITNNFFIRTSIESIFATKNVNSAPISSGMNEMQYSIRPYYRLAPGWNVFFQYQYTKDYGLLAALDTQKNDSSDDSIFTLGVSLLF